MDFRKSEKENRIYQQFLSFFYFYAYFVNKKQEKIYFITFIAG